jgi:uncharacterized Zn finger protein
VAVAINQETENLDAIIQGSQQPYRVEMIFSEFSHCENGEIADFIAGGPWGHLVLPD